MGDGLKRARKAALETRKNVIVRGSEVRTPAGRREIRRRYKAKAMAQGKCVTCSKAKEPRRVLRNECASCAEKREDRKRKRLGRVKGVRRQAKLWGPDNPAWNGDSAHEDTKRARARRRFSIGACVDCGKPATERHHVDGNPGNNVPENVKGLCRRCHMVEDGRLDAFKASATAYRDQVSAEALTRPCVNCKKFMPPGTRRHGRCAACAAYFTRLGVERPPSRAAGGGAPC